MNVCNLEWYRAYGVRFFFALSDTHFHRNLRSFAKMPSQLSIKRTNVEIEKENEMEVTCRAHTSLDFWVLFCQPQIERLILFF